MIRTTPALRRAAITVAVALAVVTAGVPAAASAATLPGTGVYLVGSQIAPTTYRSTNAISTYCSWQRLKNLSGALSGVIESGIGKGQQIVTIASTDKAFQTSGCGTWVPLSALPTSPKTSFGGGTLSVAKQITPTTYRSSNSAATYCTWSRLSNFSGSYTAIIAVGIGKGQQIVTIKAGDKGFDSAECGTWTRLSTLTTARKTSFGEGTLSVAKQVVPGTYKSSNSSLVSCNWSRLKNFDGLYTSSIASGTGKGPRTVTIAASDVGFQSSGCGTWKKIG